MLAQLLLGFVLGLRHSADADHVVAVSGLLSGMRQGPGHFRRSRLEAARIGAWWGLGHLTAIFIAGCTVIALRTRIPTWAESSLEFLVALVLIGIGVGTIRNCFAGRYHFHFHQHGGPEHAHLHFHQEGHAHDTNAHNAHLPAASTGQTHNGHWKGPLSLGMVHGLAGTASLTLLVLATIPSPWLGVTYLLIFGSGAMAGMAMLSTIVSLPLARSHAGATWLRNVRLAAGVANVAFGLFLAVSRMVSLS